MKDLWEEIQRERRATYCSCGFLGELEIQRLREENRRPEEARVKSIIDAAQKSAEQWKAIAEKLAEYLDKMCDCIDNYTGNCKKCPLYKCETSLGNIIEFAIRKAKKELGYE